MSIDDVLEIVASEPELPGRMPEAARFFALSNPEEFARAVVRLTKESIRKRLLDAERLVQ